MPTIRLTKIIATSKTSDFSYNYLIKTHHKCRKGFDRDLLPDIIKEYNKELKGLGFEILPKNVKYQYV